MMHSLNTIHRLLNHFFIIHLIRVLESIFVQNILMEFSVQNFDELFIVLKLFDSRSLNQAFLIAHVFHHVVLN
jgi:hypothetical protein